MSGVPLPSSLPDADKPRESLGHKLLRKCKQQPLVPLGVALTCGALYLSSSALRKGDPRLANRMFYWRVGFQGFTIAALIGGAWYFGDKDVGGFRGSPQDMMRKKAKERERLWIAELERIEAETQRKQAEAEKLKQKLRAEGDRFAKEVETPSSTKEVNPGKNTTTSKETTIKETTIKETTPANETKPASEAKSAAEN